MCFDSVSAEPKLEELLSALAPKASDTFSQQALEGARRALADDANPLRLNFFAIAMRILFEHMMDRFAPIEQVVVSPWFKSERKDKKPIPIRGQRMDRFAPIEQVVACPWFNSEREDGKPTRGQRIVFVIQGGLNDSFVKDALGVDVAPLRKRLLNAVDDLSKHVHGREDTIILKPAEQDAAARTMIAAMDKFLDAFWGCRAAILEPIQVELDDTAVSALIYETIQAIDELATHHCLNEICVDNMSVQAINSDCIVYSVEGSVSVTLQWGSNSDLRRGDGAERDESFRFQCEVTVPLDDPWDLSNAETVYSVDTGDWHDAMRPDD